MEDHLSLEDLLLATLDFPTLRDVPQFRVHQFVGKHVPQVRREVGFLALHLGPGGTEVHEYWEVVALLIGNGSARSVHSVVGAGNRSACCMSASKCSYQALK